MDVQRDADGHAALPRRRLDRFGEFDGSRAKFKDDVQSFSTVEPAVDLTAASPLAFAWLSVPVSSTPPPPTAQTVVTIGFDDGVADQMTALPILEAHEIDATFFVNSGVIGDAEHMSWADLHTLADAGHEIAGHTLHHVNVKPLKEEDARLEVCGDGSTSGTTASNRRRSPTRSAGSTPARRRSWRLAVTTVDEALRAWTAPGRSRRRSHHWTHSPRGPHPTPSRARRSTR